MEKGRFINFDAKICKNLYSYCTNNPVLFKDSSGYSKELSPDNLCEFGSDDWGTHSTPLPVSTLINVALRIYKDGDWKYVDGSLKYKIIDCIGLILIAAKFYFDRKTFRKTYNIGTGTNSALTNNTNGLKRNWKDNIEDLKVGTILYCDSLTGTEHGHVGIYIGYYDDGTGHPIEHAVIHCHGGKGEVKAGISIESIYGSRFDDGKGEYAEYNYLDYDLTYEDTRKV